MKYEPQTFYEHNGETHPLKEWAEILGVPYDTLRKRIQHNWPIERILQTPIRQKDDQVTVDGVALPLKDWAKHLNVSHQALYKAAKSRNLTPQQELTRRFRRDPELFPQNFVENPSKPN